MFKLRALVPLALVVAGCAAQKAPDYAAQNQPSVDAYVAVWNDGNYDSLDAVMTSDFQRRSSGGLNSDGLDAQKKVIADLRTSYPDAGVVLDESHFMKDVSFHLWTFTGTNSGPGETAPTGKAVTIHGSSLIRYRDGKISEEIVYFDVLDWQQQLGYTLSPPASDAAAATP